MRRALTTAAAVLAVFLLPLKDPARGESYCGARDSVLTQLYLKYQEQPRFIALTDAGNVLEVIISDDGQTWSIISTGPTGLTCVVQTGEHWQALDPPAPGERS